MKSSSPIHAYIHLRTVREEKEIHKNDALILATLKQGSNSCLSCASTRSTSNGMLRCSLKHKYVNHYNICISHRSIQFINPVTNQMETGNYHVETL